MQLHMSQQEAVFFAYPSRPPMLRETITNAAKAIGELGIVRTITWEQLHVSGKIIIDQITNAIDNAQVSAFELTHLNQNVMFELGYAIGSDRAVWLLRDPSDGPANRKWDAVRVLTTVGYTAYKNSNDIKDSFLREQPWVQASTIFRTAIEPSLQVSAQPSLFYMPSIHDTEAAIHLRRRIDEEKRRSIQCLIADTTESSAEILAW